MGLLNPLIFVAGFAGIIVVFNIEKNTISRRAHELRNIKFKLREGVSDEAVYHVVSSVLAAKFGMTVEKNLSGCSTVSLKKYSYDVIIGLDNTFSLHWYYKSKKKKTAKVNYNDYRILLSEYGIIAYTIQKLFLYNDAEPKVMKSNAEKNKDFTSVICKGCGGINKIKRGSVEECEFCGSPVQG